MNSAVAMFVGVTLFATMLALGLSLRIDGLRSWWRRPAMPLRALLGSTVLVPLLGLLLLQTPWSWTLTRSARTAIALMALCPSAPLAMRKARKLGGDHQLAAVIQVAAALLAIVSVPLLGLIYRHYFDITGWTVRPLDVAAQVAQVQILPLLLGLGIRHCWPNLAQRIETPLDRLANLLLLVLLVLVLFKTAPLMLAFAMRNGAALPLMLLLALGSLVIGAALSGANRSLRPTTATVTAMRNPGLALLLAERYGQGLDGLKLGILIYVLITVLVSLPLQRLQRGATA